MKLFASIAVFAVVANGVAADHWVGGVSNDVIVVQSGQSETLGVVNLLDRATLEKQGGGTLVVPLANIIQTKPFSLKVRGGKVRVCAGTAPEIAKPDAVLNKAAVWLDAADGESIAEAIGADGNKYISKWFDRRETRAEAPYQYPYAYGRSFDDAKTGANYPVKATFESHSTVFLNGYGSGSAFDFIASSVGDPTPATKALTISPSDVFVVYGQDAANFYSYLLAGSALNQNIVPYHPMSGNLIRPDNVAQLDCRWWLNGEEVDATVTQGTQGTRVFGNRFLGASPLLNGIGYYASTSYLDRNGADHYAELLLFTNRLDSVEHERIERWLCARYGKTPQATTDYTIELYDGAEIEFDGVDPASVSVQGSVRQNRPEGAVSVVDYVAREYRDVTLDSLGETGDTTVLKLDAAVKASAGQAVTVGSGYAGTEYVVSTEKARTFVKDGSGAMKLRGVASDVEKVVVRGGVLSFEPEHSSLLTETVSAIVTNADFDIDIGTDFYRNLKTSSLGGWQGHCWRIRDDWEDSYPAIVRQTAGKTQWFMYRGAGAADMEGRQYAALRGASGLSTVVEVPEDGDYILSFLYSRSSAFARLRVQIGPDLDSLSDVGAVFDIDSANRPENVSGYLTWSRRTMTVCGLKKGNCLLMFRSDASADGANSALAKSVSLFDDVALTKIPGGASVRPVVGGDFEFVTTNAAYATAQPSANRSFGASYLLDDWACVQPGGFYAIGPVTRGMGSSETFSYYSCKLEREDIPGHAQLLLGNKDGFATKTVFVPAGTWRLMADGISFHKSNALGYNTRASTVTARIGAKVTVAGQETDLGDIELAGGATPHFDAVWTTSFAVPAGGATISIRLQSTEPTGAAAAVVDNVRLVAAGGTPDGNLIADGDFSEATCGWTFDASAKSSEPTDPLYRVRALRGTVMANENEYSGCTPKYTGALSGGLGVIDDCGLFYQDVVLTEPGRYRLVYYTRTRNNHTEAPVDLQWGENRVQAYCAHGADTNSIGVVLADTTNWVQHAQVFSVNEAGTYSIGFRGLNVPVFAKAITGADSGGWDKTAFVDGISLVKIADDDRMASVPMPTSLVVRIDEGAKLALDFSGTNEVHSVRLGTHTVYGQVIDATTHPDFISGTGALKATGTPPGCVIIVR